MFFTFTDDARWNTERQAVEFGDRRVQRRGPGAAAGVPTPTAGDAHPERCVEAYYLQQTCFESIVERKLRR